MKRPMPKLLAVLIAIDLAAVPLFAGTGRDRCLRPLSVAERTQPADEISDPKRVAANIKNYLRHLSIAVNLPNGQGNEEDKMRVFKRLQRTYRLILAALRNDPGILKSTVNLTDKDILEVYSGLEAFAGSGVNGEKMWGLLGQAGVEKTIDATINSVWITAVNHLVKSANPDETRGIVAARPPKKASPARVTGEKGPERPRELERYMIAMDLAVIGKFDLAARTLIDPRPLSDILKEGGYPSSDEFIKNCIDLYFALRDEDARVLLRRGEELFKEAEKYSDRYFGKPQNNVRAANMLLYRKLAEAPPGEFKNVLTKAVIGEELSESEIRFVLAMDIILNARDTNVSYDKAVTMLIGGGRLIDLVNGWVYNDPYGYIQSCFKAYVQNREKASLDTFRAKRGMLKDYFITQILDMYSGQGGGSKTMLNRKEEAALRKYAAAGPVSATPDQGAVCANIAELEKIRGPGEVRLRVDRFGWIVPVDKDYRYGDVIIKFSRTAEGKLVAEDVSDTNPIAVWAQLQWKLEKRKPGIPPNLHEAINKYNASVPAPQEQPDARPELQQSI